MDAGDKEGNGGMRAARGGRNRRLVPAASRRFNGRLGPCGTFA